MKQRPAWLVVLNPQSGQRRARKIWARLATHLEACDVSFQVRETQAPGDATRLTRTGWEEGFRHFLAVGGDGTVNEVLNGLEAVVLPGAEALPVLAVLPAGTGNDWARVLGMPNTHARSQPPWRQHFKEKPGSKTLGNLRSPTDAFTCLSRRQVPASMLMCCSGSVARGPGRSRMCWRYCVVSAATGRRS